MPLDEIFAGYDTPAYNWFNGFKSLPLSIYSLIFLTLQNE
jgi:hypothetical protein